MADKADQALKLAQKLEKDMKTNDKAVRVDINKALKETAENFTKLHNEQTARMNEMDKRYTDLHNKQAKELNDIIAWAKKNFSEKWF
jgi:hypothetical protein